MPNYALLTVYLFAFACAVSVSWWATVSGPKLLERYTKPVQVATPTGSQLLFLSAVVQGAGFFVAQNDPFIVSTVPLWGLFAIMVWIDSLVHKLPNHLTAMAAGYLLFGVVVASFGPVDFDYLALASSVAFGALVWVIPLWLLRRIGAGVGGGDVKLAPVIGGWLGLYGGGIAVSGLAMAFILGGTFALFLLLSARATWKSAVAFGPAMISGAVCAWFVSGFLVSS
ncbi:MAG: A24 family peptidase [Actinomycetaceae bacterium]|nr:A24 family peptidase [Actinomycetaceae bacterium]